MQLLNIIQIARMIKLKIILLLNLYRHHKPNQFLALSSSRFTRIGKRICILDYISKCDYIFYEMLKNSGGRRYNLWGHPAPQVLTNLVQFCCSIYGLVPQLLLAGPTGFDSWIRHCWKTVHQSLSMYAPDDLALTGVLAKFSANNEVCYIVCADYVYSLVTSRLELY
jgi:hypothetical protein